MTRSICTISVLCVLVVAACTQYAVSDDENYNPKWELRFPSEQEMMEKGVPVVEQYMQLMIRDRIDRAVADESERYALLSQEYLATQEIDPKLYKLNDYAFEEYEILGVERNYVKVQGFHHTTGWSRILTFRMLVENEKLVIEPSNVSRQNKPLPIRNFLTPWWMDSERIRIERLGKEFPSPNVSREGGAGNLSIVPDGMRVVTIKVNNTGMDYAPPGIRVDVIRTGTPPEGSEGVVSRIILENIQVLSAGQVVEQNPDGQSKKVNIVTLLVTPEQAQKLLITGEYKFLLALHYPLDSED
jgi:hypothetical protein